MSVADALEALGHPGGALPEPRLLADLFVRFQAQVPLRASGAGRTSAGESLAAWLDEGSGLCGEARLAAFEALAAAAGFPLERGTALHPGEGKHPVLLAEGGRLLLDPAFPLPAPLRLDSATEGESTGYGTLSVRRDGGAPAVILETRGDERTLFVVARGGSAAGPAPARKEEAAGLFRLFDDRLLRWSDGVLEVSDSWSRLRVAFPAADAEGLEALFGPPLPEALPSPQSRPRAATLAVYHASAESSDRLRELLADPATHAALLPGGWAAERRGLRADGFEQDLFEEGRILRRERVTLLPDGLSIEAEGALALFRTRTFRLEPRPAGTRLRLLATLRDPVPPRGLPEGTRRRLVFELASELLALDRVASES